MAFAKATKKKAKARIAIAGPAGSGKTWNALELALALGSKIALADTEHGSASKYSHRFNFDVDDLEEFSPARYIKAIHEAEAAGYDVLVIDSLTHAWSGAGGILEQADKLGGQFNAWKTLTPQQNKLIEAIMSAKIHIIATLRTKTEYVIEKTLNRNNREVSTPKKVGLAPVQRDGMEYEFDIVLLADENNTLTTTKTRCAELKEQAWRHETPKLAEIIKAWLTDGEDQPEKPAPTGKQEAAAAEASAATGIEQPVTPESHITKEVAEKISEAMTRAGVNKDPKARLTWISGELKRPITKSGDITAKEGGELLVSIGKLINEKAGVPGGAQ